MPGFHRDIHNSANVLATVNLRPTDVANFVPVLGPRTTESESGHNLVTTKAHNFNLPKWAALVIWEDLPEARKNNPNNFRRAMGYKMIAQAAGVEVPQSIEGQVPQPGHAEYQQTEVLYVSPGSPIIAGSLEPRKLLSFIYCNSDVGWYCKWEKMTGREQYEWIFAWQECQKSYDRFAARTLGLRGTNPNRIQDQATLETCLTRSPSLRSRRPANHNWTQAQWDAVVSVTLGTG